MNPDFSTLEYRHHPELLLAATLQLLSSSVLQHLCSGRARLIVQHLQLLSQDATLDVALRKTCQQLLAVWNEAAGLLRQVEGGSDPAHEHPTSEGFVMPAAKAVH